MKLKDLKHGKCYRTSRYFFIFDETRVSFPEDDDITNIYIRFMGAAIDFTWYADYPQVHVVSGAWMWLDEEIEEFEEKTLAAMIKLVTVATDNVLKVINYEDKTKSAERDEESIF